MAIDDLDRGRLSAAISVSERLRGISVVLDELVGVVRLTEKSGVEVRCVVTEFEGSYRWRAGIVLVVAGARQSWFNIRGGAIGPFIRLLERVRDRGPAMVRALEARAQGSSTRGDHDGDRTQ